MSKKRKWNKYVRFRFTCLGKTEDLQKPVLWATMKNICELKEPVLIFEQPFQN